MPFPTLSKTVSCLFACVAFAAIMSVEAANATIYYVATNGSDSYPGTNTQPLRTIAAGVKELSAGDTLYVKVGDLYGIYSTLASSHPQRNILEQSHHGGRQSRRYRHH